MSYQLGYKDLVSTSDLYESTVKTDRKQYNVYEGKPLGKPKEGTEMHYYYKSYFDTKEAALEYIKNISPAGDSKYAIIEFSAKHELVGVKKTITETIELFEG